MKPSEVLASALARFQNGAAWCKGTYARDKFDVQVWYGDKCATKWCAVGSLRVEKTNALFTAADYLQRAAHMMTNIPAHWPAVPYINDTATSFGIVREMYERAIFLAELEGQ